MKKLFTFLFLAQCLIMYGQIENKAVPGGSSCISGSLTINVGQTVTFTSVNDAQCSQCYDWDINDNSASSDNSVVGNLQIVGSDMNKNVSIKGIFPGIGKIRVTYFTESGCNSCELQVNVVNPICNTNVPVVKGDFFCRNGTTNGQFSIDSDDWSTIASVNILLNGANFRALYSGNTITLLPPFTGNSIMLFVKDSVASDCYFGNNFVAVVTFTFNNGCSSTQTIRTFTDEETPPVPALISKKNKIELFPNPTNSIIEFKGENLNKSFITIYDSNGKIIVNQSNLNNKIDISKQNKGTYIYKIESENKVIQEGKILKK